MMLIYRADDLQLVGQMQPEEDLPETTMASPIMVAATIVTTAMPITTTMTAMATSIVTMVLTETAHGGRARVPVTSQRLHQTPRHLLDPNGLTRSRRHPGVEPEAQPDQDRRMSLSAMNIHPR